MAFRTLLIACCALVSMVLAQVGSSYCDATSGICFVGYTDTEQSMTMGIVLPPISDPPSDEYIVQLVAPASFGWSGISMGGAMTNSLLFPMWPSGSDIMVGPRWADDYVLPGVYTGPTITLLPASTINNTHINAIFRCQNCTVWQGGSLGSGNLNGTNTLAYVSSSTTGPADPSDIDSTFQEHDFFGFFGVDLSAAHSDSYTSYIGGGTSSTTAPSGPSSTTPSSTSSAPSAGQTVGAYGQCGGNGYTGSTTCTSGYTCVAVSPPYYSQCQPN